MRLTFASKAIIAAIILIGLYFGIRRFTATNPELVQTARSGIDPVADAPRGSTPPATPAETPAAGPRPAFTYAAPAPVDGKLKGVVELGASGFNSFIVRIDKQRTWKLEKADFGNSLVMENMASDEDIRKGLKAYIGQMLDYGVGGRDIHFVVSSGALKAEGTGKIVKALKSLNYVVNTVTPEKEGMLGLRSVLPASFADRAFVADIGSGNTKISWLDGNQPKAVETFGAKYFEKATPDATVAADVKAKVAQVPADLRGTCFIIGGVPFELAKKVRKGKERYTVLDAPSAYQLDNAKSKAGLNIYQSIAEATGCRQFVFDWDANFTIGYLLTLPQ
ncbi:acetate and sugar kinases/Hsc70/actin family protein [Hymenobacter terricola]|uniref:hypothetical protein n=1 Tax=Hymenobacter terricola TaxID=2819236 RepID=UPI001B302E08|nr:hypothetical protein [Hymenobacter terricola]